MMTRTIPLEDLHWTGQQRAPAELWLPTAQILRLPNGRQLAYQETGDREGIPVLYFHSVGGSRLESDYFSQSARRSGIRLIAVDRPGIGCSDFQALATPVALADLLLELADALALPKFGLMSLSTGGLFALALAAKAPERVAFHLNLGATPGGHCLARQISPLTCRFLLLHRLLPAGIRWFTRIRHTLTGSDLQAHLTRLTEMLCYTDRKIMSNPAVRKTLEASMTEALRQGVEGIAQDTALGFVDPGFSLKDIRIPLYIWQGCADQLDSPVSGAYVASRIPGSEYHAVPHRGHFFFVHCMDEIFARVRPEEFRSQQAFA